LTSVSFHKINSDYWEVFLDKTALGYLELEYGEDEWCFTAYREQFSNTDLADILQKLNELNENLSVA